MTEGKLKKRCVKKKYTKMFHLYKFNFFYFYLRLYFHIFLSNFLKPPHRYGNYYSIIIYHNNNSLLSQALFFYATMLLLIIRVSNDYNKFENDVSHILSKIIINGMGTY